jgi:hypothetical protein
MTEKTLLIEPFYLPNTDYFSLISRYQKVCLDFHGHYERRTFRNRAYVLNAEKTVELTVPVKMSSHFTAMCDVRTEQNQRFAEIHFRTLQSCYGKSAFWLYFGDIFEKIYLQKHEFLAEFNFMLTEMLAQKLGLSTRFYTSEKYYEGEELEQFDDFRGRIHPRKASLKGDFEPYTHVFSPVFVPNLSVLDVLLTQGKAAKRFF